MTPLVECGCRQQLRRRERPSALKSRRHPDSQYRTKWEMDLPREWSDGFVAVFLPMPTLG